MIDRARPLRNASNCRLLCFIFPYYIGLDSYRNTIDRRRYWLLTGFCSCRFTCSRRISLGCHLRFRSSANQVVVCRVGSMLVSQFIQNILFRVTCKRLGVCDGPKCEFFFTLMQGSILTITRHWLENDRSTHLLIGDDKMWICGLAPMSPAMSCIWLGIL